MAPDCVRRAYEMHPNRTPEEAPTSFRRGWFQRGFRVVSGWLQGGLVVARWFQMSNHTGIQDKYCGYRFDSGNTMLTASCSTDSSTVGPSTRPTIRSVVRPRVRVTDAQTVRPIDQPPARSFRCWLDEQATVQQRFSSFQCFSKSGY